MHPSKEPAWATFGKTTRRQAACTPHTLTNPTWSLIQPPAHVRHNPRQKPVWSNHPHITTVKPVVRVHRPPSSNTPQAWTRWSSCCFSLSTGVHPSGSSILSSHQTRPYSFRRIRLFAALVTLPSCLHPRLAQWHASCTIQGRPNSHTSYFPVLCHRQRSPELLLKPSRVDTRPQALPPKMSRQSSHQIQRLACRPWGYVDQHTFSAAMGCWCAVVTVYNGNLRRARRRLPRCEF